MKTTLITTIALVSLLLAGAAFAQDFHPILDADYLGDLGANDATTVLDDMNPGPHFDADWDGPALNAADSPVLVVATFDPLLDADFLGGVHGERGDYPGAGYRICDLASR